MKTIVLLIVLAFSISFSNGQSVSLSSNSTTVGGTILVYWSGFSGNVNIMIYKGPGFWIYANTNGSPSGSQALVTTGWEIRNDYRVKVEQKNNTNIYAYSEYFSVTASLPDFVVTSVSGPSNIVSGQTVSVIVQGRNQGLTPSQSGSYVMLRAILSPDQQINLSDQIYLDINIPIGEFTGGVTIGRTYNFPIPNYLSGTYYWGGYIDAATFWNESNENNNALLGNSIIVQPPTPPAIPTLQSPSNNSTLNYNNPTLTWTGNNSVYFHVQIDNNNNFSSPERENSYVNAFSWTPSALPDGTYFWRVRAYGTNGNWSAWSSSWAFSINTLPDFVITSVTGPVTGTAGQFVNVTIQCRNQGNNPTQTGTHVVLRAILSTDQQINLSDQHYLDYNIPINDFSGGATLGKTFSFQLPTDFSGTYYWGGYIDAATFWNESNENNNALIGNSIVIQQPAPPTIPVLQLPANNAVLNYSNPTFSWTGSNASYFNIQIDDNSNFTSPERENSNVNAFSWTPAALPDGIYYWRVRAYGVNGNWSAWSNSWTFSISTLPDFVITSVTGPVTGTAGQIANVTIQCRNQGYNPIQTGTYVVLRAILSSDQQINLADQHYVDYNIPINDFSGGVTVSQTFNFQIPAGLSGTYYWGGYIDAATFWNESNEDNNALAGNSFLTAGSGQLLLNSPEPNAIVQEPTITFNWDQLNNANSYKLFVDNNLGFGSPEIAPYNIPVLQNLQNNSFTISGNWLSENVYYWKVLAITSTDTITSEVRSFTYQPLKTSTPQWVPFYRAYLPSDADHFYCSSESHLIAAIDGNYQFEGVEGFVALYPFETASTEDLRPIYRFYVPDNTTPRTKGHYYTSSDTDKDNRIIQGWVYEGITGYAYKESKAGLVPLYHTWLNIPDERNDNFYTISEIEKNNSIALFGYTDQGIICYTSPNGALNQVSYNQNGLDFGKGINPQNGNLTNPSSGSLNVTEGKVSLNYSHFYNSLEVRYFSNVNPLGNGWNHAYNASILTTDSLAIVVWPGEVNYYDLHSRECLTPGTYDKLWIPNAEEFTITKKDQTVFRFSKILTSPLNNTYLLTSIIDRNNNQVTLQYNNNGRLKSVKSPGNKYITFNYYPETDYLKSGLIHYVKDSLALNRVMEYQYDNDRNLIAFVDEMNQTTTHTYDTDSRFDHFLTLTTYPDGSTVRNTYDQGTKRLTAQSTISGSPETKLQISTPSPNQVYVTDEIGKSVGMHFNDLGNITQLTTLNGNAIFEFNNPNNPTKPTSIKDGMGYITTITYDNMGNPLNISKPHGAIYKYQWNSSNDLTLYTNPLNKQTHYSYSNGNLISVQTPRGTSTMSYLPNGNLNSYTNPLGKIQNFTYDAMNNLQTISDALGNTTTYNYDIAGRRNSITDAEGNTTSFSFFNNNLLANSTDALGKVTQISYDIFGKLTGVTDARNHTTAMAYDASTGLLVQMTDQIGNASHYQYLDNGLLESILNRNGQTINYTYDSTNRLKTAVGPSLSNSFSYNKNDLPTQIQDLNGIISFNYDSLNRLISYTDYYFKQVKYEYDSANNLKKIIYPGNLAVQYNYYDDNLLHTVTDWLNHVTIYTYLSDGSLSRVDLPNGTYSTYSYDNAGRLVGIENKKAGGAIICSYVYTLDRNGNHTAEQVQEPLEPPEIQYMNVSYTYDNANRIQQAGPNQFTHDFNGNLKSAVSPTESYNYNYNTKNKLISVSGSFNASYIYDAMGNRRAAIRNGISTRYVLDISGSLDNVLVEYDASNTAQYYYIHGAGLLYRIKASDNSIQCYHYDSRGSTTAITNQTQNITHKYVYDEFGKVLVAEEADFNPYRFVGGHGVMFENNKLYFMRERYYCSETGRFLSEDPLRNLNLYPYSENNPITKIDPNGLEGFDANEWKKRQVAIKNIELRYQLKRYIEESEKQEKRENQYAELVFAIEFGKEGFALCVDTYYFDGAPVTNSIFGGIDLLANLFQDGWRSANNLFGKNKKR